jgi:hypothetical protein
MTTTMTIILNASRLRGSMSVYSSSDGSRECMSQLDPVTQATFGALSTHRVGGLNLHPSAVPWSQSDEGDEYRDIPGKESRRRL